MSAITHDRITCKWTDTFLLCFTMQWLPCRLRKPHVDAWKIKHAFWLTQCDLLSVYYAAENQGSRRSFWWEKDSLSGRVMCLCRFKEELVPGSGEKRDASVMLIQYLSLFIKFELQSMLIHCDVTRAQEEACTDLPARTLVRRIKNIYIRILKCYTFRYLFMTFFEKNPKTTEPLGCVNSKHLVKRHSVQSFWVTAEVKSPAKSGYWCCVRCGPSPQCPPFKPSP